MFLLLLCLCEHLIIVYRAPLNHNWVDPMLKKYNLSNYNIIMQHDLTYVSLYIYRYTIYNYLNYLTLVTFAQVNFKYRMIVVSHNHKVTHHCHFSSTSFALALSWASAVYPYDPFHLARINQRLVCDLELRVTLAGCLQPCFARKYFFCIILYAITLTRT